MGLGLIALSPQGVATRLACRGLKLEESEAEKRYMVCSSTCLKGVVLKASHIAKVSCI